MIKSFTYLKVISLAFIFTSCSSSSKLEPWQKTLELLSNASKIQYSVITDIQQYDMKQSDTTEAYIDIDNRDSLIGAYYLYEHNAGMTELYSGQLWGTILSEDKVVITEKNASVLLLQSSISLMTSPFFIQKILEGVADSSFSINNEGDTLINGENYIRYSIDMQGKWMAIDGKKTEIDGALNTYEFWINKEDYTPYAYISTIPEGNGKVTAFMTNYRFNDEADKKLISDALFPQDFKKMNLRSYYFTLEARMRLTPGASYPPFIMEMLNGDMLKSAELRGKITLLEFWFPGCAPCIQAIPYMKEIQSKYQSENIRIIAVEYENRDIEEVNNYIEKHAIDYPIAINGKGVGQQMGILGAPTFVLFDEEGILINYFSNDEKDNLDAAISELLSK